MKNIFKKDNLLTIVIWIPVKGDVSLFTDFMSIIFKYVQKSDSIHRPEEYIGMFEIKESKYVQLTKELSDKNIKIVKHDSEIMYRPIRVEPA